MSIETSEFHAAIPPEIRLLFTARNILSTEDPKAYNALRFHLWELCRPKNVLQWLGFLKLHDLVWEQLRLRRIKPAIIESARKKALSRLLLSMTNESVRDFTPSGNATRAEEAAVDWFTNPSVKKEIQALLGKFNYSQNTIDAMAVVERQDELIALEKMQMMNDARQFAVRRQFEEDMDALEVRSTNENVEDDVAPTQLTHKKRKA
jgi:hypothetical protein